MAPQSIADLILIISNEYRALKNKEVGNIDTRKIFDVVIKKTYNSWGERFGLRSISELKSIYGSRKKILSPIKTEEIVQTKHSVELLIDPLLEEIEKYHLKKETYFF